MEKLLRRTLLSRNQLVSKKRRDSAKDLRKAWREYNRVKMTQDTEFAHLARRERIARREDWILGPLAPRRDVGGQKDTYGAVDSVMAQGPQLPTREQRGPRGRGYDAAGTEDQRLPSFEDGEWKGEGLSGNLVIGDRVVAIRGRLGVKGKIGEVVRIDKKSNMVIVKGVNKVDLVVPPQALNASGGLKIYEQELPIPLSDVRLVTQLQDPDTLVKQDVIVSHIHGGPPYYQRDNGSNLPRHTRYITNYALADGTTADIEIPWPKEDPDRFYTQASDTTRDKVEERSYWPKFNEEPLEGGVIDELRDKHSRLRRDWDDMDMMKQKMLEDARRDWFKDRSKILSQPFWAKGFLAREKKTSDQKDMLRAAEAAKEQVLQEDAESTIEIYRTV